jgi:hypothetical protein
MPRLKVTMKMVREKVGASIELSSMKRCLLIAEARSVDLTAERA